MNTTLSVDDWLALRKEAALQIDPLTAEVMWTYGYVIDPYGVHSDLLDEEKCVGRLYFARAPESDIWVSYYDLPAETLRVLRESGQERRALEASYPMDQEIGKHGCDWTRDDCSAARPANGRRERSGVGRFDAARTKKETHVPDKDPPQKDPETGRFLTGNSGGGRPKGSRNKLGEAFLETLAQDFAEHGRAAIVACREEKPTEYVKVIAGLLPKELLLRKDPVEEMSDEEIADVLETLKGIVAAGRGSGHEKAH